MEVKCIAKHYATVLINFDYTSDEKYAFIKGQVSKKSRNNTGKAKH